MPKFNHLSDDDIKAIDAYLTNEAWGATKNSSSGNEQRNGAARGAARPTER